MQHQHQKCQQQQGGSCDEPIRQRDSHDGAGALEEGYDTFMDDKKEKSVGVSSSLRRRLLNLKKNITSSVGEYLPNTLSELWETLHSLNFQRAVRGILSRQAGAHF